MINTSFFLIFSFLVVSSGLEAKEIQLFGKDVLRISIKTDFDKLLDSKRFYKKKENALIGSLTYNKENFDIKVSTAGNTRLSCDMPPLKINFSKKNAKDKVFDINYKMKLITHCDRYRSAKNLNEKVYREYKKYKQFEKKSDYHFKTQLVIVDYFDINDSSLFHGELFLGFFIESDRSIEKRTNTKEVKFDQLGWSLNNYPNVSLNKKQLKKVKRFNWWIGNPDYGVSMQLDDGRLSRKNIKVFIKNDIGYAIPYDFDRSRAVFKNNFTVYSHKLFNWSEKLYKAVD